MVGTLDAIKIFEEYASLSDDIQRRVIEIDNKPRQRKQLRAFPTREAATLLGISDSYLRRLVLDEEDLPKGEVLGNGKRSFRLSEINAIRRWLYRRTRDLRYHIGRGAGEKLQVLSFSNFKGGAAKTTTAVHLAQYLALRGYRVLLIDLDSQASATGLFGFSPDEDLDDGETLYPYMRGDVTTLQPLIRSTYWDGLDIVPANLSLYRIEFELPVQQLRQESFRFWRLLSNGIATIEDSYDVIICDSPPSLGYLSINALFAATGLIIPAPPSMLDFASTGRFFRMMADTLADIADFEGAQGTRLDFIRILISKYNTVDRNHERIAAWMVANYGDRLLRNRMAVTTALDMAGNTKRTLYELEAGSKKQSAERGLDFMDRVNAEIEGLLFSQWGRAQVRQRESVEV